MICLQIYFRIKKTSAIQEQVSLSHTYSSQSTQHPNTTSQGTSPSVTQPLNNTMDNINFNIIAKYWVNILISQSRIIKISTKGQAKTMTKPGVDKEILINGDNKSSSPRESFLSVPHRLGFGQETS